VRIPTCWSRLARQARCTNSTWTSQLDSQSQIFVVIRQDSSCTASMRVVGLDTALAPSSLQVHLTLRHSSAICSRSPIAARILEYQNVLHTRVIR
jgi:hypothetical protein